MLDEADTIFGGKQADRHEGLRALFNAGNRRGTTVPRCVGPKHQLKDFNVYCPKAFAGIGTLPDTVADRSIPIRMKRKARNEPVERLRGRIEAEALLLRKLLEAWSFHVPSLADAEPLLPSELDDCAQDSWEPLLAIADTAGGKCPQTARAAAVRLHEAAAGNEEPLGILLLEHIRAAFGDSERIGTEGLLRALIRRDDGPWAGWWSREVEAVPPQIRGPASRLARLLKPFGLRSKNQELPDGTVAKGYERSDFEDAWTRYLPQNESLPLCNVLEVATSLPRRSKAVLASPAPEIEKGSEPRRRIESSEVATFGGGMSSRPCPRDPGRGPEAAGDAPDVLG